MPNSRIGVHSFPECKQLWDRMDARIQDQAIQFASLLWNTPRDEMANELPSDLVRDLRSAGVIHQDDEGWRLAPAEMLFFLRAIDLIDSLVLHSRQAEEVLQELEQLVESARDDSINRFKDYRQVARFILAELVNEYGREDVPAYAVSDEIEDHQFWYFYDLICGSLPILELTIHNLARVVGAAERRARGDMVGGRTYQAAEQLGLSRPDFALEVVDYLAEAADGITAGFLERLLTGIAKSSPKNLGIVVARCELWLEAEQEPLCQAGICCSENLILDDELDPEWLLSRFDSLSAKSANVRFTLTTAVATLGANAKERSGECLDMLQRLKVAGPLDSVTYGIAYALSRIKDDIAIDYKVACLSLLEDAPAKNKGAVQRIRRVLDGIIESHSEEVWKYLRRWIVSHEIGGSIVQHDMFLHTIQDVYQHDPALGRRVLSDWFSASDLRLVEEARSILAELGICAFDPEVIGGMPAPVIVYLTEKLLVGHFEPIQLMRLFHSILVNTAELERMREYFSAGLRYLAWNYLGAAQTLFDRTIDEHDSSISHTILVEIRHQLEEYQRQREGVFVGELSSSKRRVEKYYQLEGKKMQAVQEALFEDDRFPLQKLISRVSIARGDRTFHMEVFHPDPVQRRTFTEPRGFSKLSESVELPRGEIIDPEGEALRRIGRLNRTLGDLQEDERP